MRADGHLHTGLLTELLTYKHISKQPANRRAFLMELQAVLQNEDSVLFVMPLMQNDLLSVIQGPVDSSRARWWIAQVALGIDALHAMGIIHRDIKPENVLLDAHTNIVRITDFNAAFLHPGDAPLETGAVYTREYAGSKPYLAPEIVRRQWYGKMVDWWSLGCMMFDLVSGELLFGDEAQRAKYAKWDAKKEGTSYLRWAADLTRDEEGVLLGLLHLAPNSRFQLAQLQRHRYFVDERGSNVFHVLGEQMHASPGSRSLLIDGHRSFAQRRFLNYSSRAKSGEGARDRYRVERARFLRSIAVSLSDRRRRTVRIPGLCLGPSSGALGLFMTRRPAWFAR
ncbi:kinase-like domain-containing protein [Fomitopsis serialis]|uniref:kinase-like domain-containing protein n=1 Tax=Fomitopsis serialis TaxID=139415 RepID=UPI002007AC04|nr:kinase-like domain-containing protein [Neoantrodia serialis]KAH9934134.1 kinase-like domain-containing protein [Neoantrodia serialis]